MKLKNINTALLGIFLLLSATSCKKFLDVQPKSAAPDDLTIVDKASAETALRGVYRSLASSSYYGTTFQFAIYLQGGELEWGDSRTVNLQFIQHNVQADNEEVQAVWSAIYQTINRANHVISKVPAIADASFTETLKSSILGEAYFIRALAYFDLARTWGGVQIVLEPTASATDKIGIQRSSLDDTYAQVLNDLTAAEQLLPETVNRIRATRKTVYALRARYHLYRQEWQAAADYASLLINDSENYLLVYPYSAFFANNAVATNESIFETNYSSVYPNEHRDTWQPQDKGGIRRWFPSETFVAAVTDPSIGGNRSVLVEKTADGRWYGNLYYRSDPKTDPSFVLRIAEQYLIRAEARAHLEDIMGALEDLNAIRTRADLEPTSLSTTQDLLNAIEQERRFEFAFEPHRWFDLVRTQRAATVLNVTDPNKYVLPLPANELSVDPALIQNPGY